MPLSKKHQVLIERVMTGVPNLVRVRKVLNILSVELRVGVGQVRGGRKSLPDRGNSRCDCAEVGKMRTFQELKEAHVVGR